ncbi:hypothetical protein FDECE_10937 [Fusarium decemcellulare]|nr:hypothetical protein FDECE_10937 [Fusarium decemcellulare]
MGLKQFNLDLRAAASSCDNPQVTNVRKGDSDGEIVFTYSLEGHPPIEIQALATDADCYPKHSSFLIFTSSDHVTHDLDGWLQDIAPLTDGKNVVEVLALISRKLSTRFKTSSDVSQPPAFDDEEQTDGSAFDTGDYSDSNDEDEEYQIDIDPLPPRRQAPLTASGYPGSTLRLKRHLREAKTAGFHIYIPFTKKVDESLGIFSLSIHVSKLGIPDEALEAWDLKASDYVVMLTKVPVGYPDLADFIDLPSDQSTVQFKFGKCAAPRPSYQSMRSTFDPDDGQEPQSAPGEAEVDQRDLFLPLYMSASLDSLLNQELPSLLRIRRYRGLSWDEAQEVKYELSRGNHHNVMKGSNSDIHVKGQADWFGLEFLRRDYVSGDSEDLNILLVTMQFGLQRLIKCTKYCMVCHQRVDTGFEAVKPFVCENLLCLYQYLSLGFGQSIEHEIINSPYVVDLLISFFYAAACSHGLREFPQGLGLKCPETGRAMDPAEHLDVEVCFKSKTIRFDNANYASYRQIKEGHHVLLVIKGVETMPSSSIMNGSLERHTCVIESFKGADCTFAIVATRTTPLNVELPDGKQKTQATHPDPGWAKVMLFKHSKDIDDIPPAERDQNLMLMSHSIPSVLEMRQYLMGRPGRRLSSWKRIDTSALALLNWIVASNRSFIVQDAPVPHQVAREDPHTKGVNSSNLVRGIGGDWMQFRFAQGSPEKEQVFFKELKKLKDPDGYPKAHPSLFAWHGSALENWHSIIRAGLDFSKVLNGRACGDGVYFSKDFCTSQGYSGRSYRTSVTGGHCWPNSELRVTSAISICEIINEPTKFICTNPHFVVNKIEWIQCRYLFVQCRALASQQTAYQKQKSPTSYLNQDPIHELKGPDRQTVNIPLSAIPATRRRALGQQSSVNKQGVTKDNPIMLDGVDDDMREEINDELDELLASDDEDQGNRIKMVRKRRRASTDSGLGEQRPSKLTTAMQDSTNPTRLQSGQTTPFQPGSLDIGSLPKLVEPTWAASSPAALRALNKDIKDLQKMQSGTDLASLGWYIDFEKLDNLFHWIVELHSFDKNLPLAQDMMRAGCSSIVLELRFGASYPISPPFVRVVRPRFLPFAQGGGGHVTAGGAICSELLTNSGWSPALSLEKVFIEVRTNLCDIDPPARLDSSSNREVIDYNILEAVEAFRRAATTHRWQIPSDLEMITAMAAQRR